MFTEVGPDKCFRGRDGEHSPVCCRDGVGESDRKDCPVCCRDEDGEDGKVCCRGRAGDLQLATRK